MKFRSRISGVIVETDHHLGYPYEPLEVSIGPKSARIAPETPPPAYDTAHAETAPVYRCGACGREYKTLAGITGHTQTHLEEE